MPVKEIVSLQYRQKVNKAASQWRHMSLPPEGWLRTARKALAMPVVQLARRLKKSRGLVTNTEMAELSGSVTLKTMKAMAEAMGYRFVYAIVPQDSVEALLQEQAHKKARRIVTTSSRHMALEAQTPSEKHINSEIKRLQQAMLRDLPSDFWKDDE